MSTALSVPSNFSYRGPSMTDNELLTRLKLLWQSQATRDQLEAVATEIARRPRLLADLHCFMVDFVGTADGEAQTTDVNDLPAMMDRLGGGLYRNVRGWLIDKGWNIADAGGGAGRWHLGVHCTPSEAWLLGMAANARFVIPITNNLLQIHIIAWNIKQ